MPVHRQAAKRVRQAKKHQIRNRAVKSKLKKQLKKFNTLLIEEKMNEARDMLPVLFSAWDKAAGQGIIHKNTASRRKTRLAKKLKPRKA